MRRSISSIILALSPLIVFLMIYLVTSIVTGDFYTVPVSSAFLISCIYALAISKGNIRERIEIFSEGAGNKNILLMIWIFILAGAFAGTAQDIGAVDATVNLTLKIIPPKMLLAGMFLTACFISMSIGTSVGTIVALVPIANGIATQSGLDAPYMAAVIIGGALFGDNLSFISDTTIAATRAMECEMKDKFRVNIYIVIPAVVIVSAIYVIQGLNIEQSGELASQSEWFKLIPYLLIIGLALSGQNVTLILTIGIVANAVIGFITGAFDWSGWLTSAGNGIGKMNELIIITLLAGGLLETMRRNGAIDLIIGSLSSHIKGKRGAQLSIAAIVCLANLCTANNTIAIITTGSIAKEINDKFGLDPRKTASILDTFSCLVQGIIPYGAQVLMAAGMAGCSPTAILPHLYYPFLMGVVALLAILLRCPRKYSL